ncbi:MAG: DUF2807 domain-containing protein [Sphingobacteriaceae bacterium]|nr:MAG: DUF2807 domain-containing protein [Sphingobacteriaceae bacterium]
MKKALYLLFTGLLLTTMAFAQTTQSRQVAGFNSIASAGSFNVHVKIDGTESLKITGDEEVINDIETTVSDGKLKIGSKNKNSWTKLFNNKRVDIYITAKSLSGLSSSGSGNIKLDGNLTGNAEIWASGSGSITAAVNANELQIALSGSGNVTSSISTKELTASVSGSGGMSLSGNVTNANIKVSGSGNLRAKDLKADVVSASVSGSGNINITAEKTISAQTSGSGRITYSGNATTVDIRKSGSGKVVKG